MTKREIEKIKARIEKLENEKKEDRETWINDHIDWLGCDRAKAENDYIKHLTFIDATLAIYRKALNA